VLLAITAAVAAATALVETIRTSVEEMKNLAESVEKTKENMRNRDIMEQTSTDAVEEIFQTRERELWALKSELELKQGSIWTDFADLFADREKRSSALLASIDKEIEKNKELRNLALARVETNRALQKIEEERARAAENAVQVEKEKKDASARILQKIAAQNAAFEKAQNAALEPKARREDIFFKIGLENEEALNSEILSLETKAFADSANAQDENRLNALIEAKNELTELNKKIEEERKNAEKIEQTKEEMLEAHRSEMELLNAKASKNKELVKQLEQQAEFQKEMSEWTAKGFDAETAARLASETIKARARADAAETPLAGTVGTGTVGTGTVGTAQNIVGGGRSIETGATQSLVSIQQRALEEAKMSRGLLGRVANAVEKFNTSTAVLG